MIKLGITGNIACGKSLIEQYLKEIGVPVIDSDEVVHRLYKEPCFIGQIKAIFENQDVTENGELSRSKIGKIVFSDKAKLHQLESLLHPVVNNRIEEFFNENNDQKIACASVPLLFEAGMKEMFDFVVTVFANPEIQLKRLLSRNGISQDDAIKRINSQMPQEEKKQLADFVVDNSGDKEETKDQLVQLLKIIISKY